MPDLPPDARAKYLDAGYYVASNLVGQECLDVFVRDLNAIVRAQLAHRGLGSNRSDDIESVHANLAALHGHDQTLYLATLRVFNKLKSLYDIFLSDRIAQACRQLGIVLPLLHTLPLFHIMSHKLLLDHGYHGFTAHQDWTGVQSSLNTISVWLPFHDTDKNRFPLEVLPHSHLQGVCRGVVENDGYTIDDAYHVNKPFVPLSVSKGDVVFMSCFTIHRSGMSDGDQLRMAASWRYEDALEETFIARRYPFAQTRVVGHGLVVPDFPSAEQMRQLLD